MIEIVPRNYLPFGTHVIDVSFGSYTINTLFTSVDTHPIDNWITEVINNNNRHNRNCNGNDDLIVGLDVEWRPNTTRNNNNPVATLQLCVGHKCLVFHIIHAPYVPQSLINFLRNPNNVFVGVGIEGDVQKLLEDYRIHVPNYVDLRVLATDVYYEREMRSAGLKTLARRVMGVELEKPERITRSAWDSVYLSREQVEYACIDAFVSFEIGRRLFRLSDNGYGF